MRNNRLFAVVFGILLLFLAVFGESVAPLLLLLALTLLVGGSLLAARVYAGGVAVAVTVADIAEKGRPLQGEITVTNSGPFPFTHLETVVKVENRLTGETSRRAVVHLLPPRGEARSELVFSAEHCGKIKVAIEKKVFYDFFGIFGFSRPGAAEAEALVLPEMVPLEVTIVKSGVTEPECDKFSPYKAGDDPSETFAIRDYEPGDALRSIHWKLSGKFDRLVIREASLPVNESVLILFERIRPPQTAAASAAARAALGEIVVSLSERLTEMNIAHTIGWLREENDTFLGHRVDSEEAFQLMLSEILSVSERPGTENTIEGFMKTPSISGYSNIVYIGTTAPENLFLLPLMAKKTVILCQEGDGTTAEIASDLYIVTPENYETALYPLLI